MSTDEIGFAFRTPAAAITITHNHTSFFALILRQQSRSYRMIKRMIKQRINFFVVVAMEFSSIATGGKILRSFDQGGKDVSCWFKSRKDGRSDGSSEWQNRL